MKQMSTLLRRAGAVGVLLAAAYGIAGVPVSAQDATTSTTTTTTSTTTKKAPKTTATPEMIAEAVARSKARHDKFLADGTPEQFGSEEPFITK
jgi:hypothetical protein